MQRTPAVHRPCGDRRSERHTPPRWRLALSALSLLAAASLPSLVRADDPPAITLDSRELAVKIDGRAHLEYRYRRSPYKPYIRQWRTPGGTPVLRDAPHDHLHHHALMFAIGAGGVDFWSESKGAGAQIHMALDGVSVSRDESPTPSAAFSHRVSWAGPESDTPLLHEVRRIEVFHPGTKGASLLDWNTRLSPAEGRGAVTIDGRHYFGLGMRFVESMDAGGRFFNPDGAEGTVIRGTERLVRSRWCAYTARAEGKPVTVAMFDHPENERAPATWFTMTSPFAYLSATLALHETPIEVEEGKALALRYGVALWDGDVPAEKIEALYRWWLRTSSLSDSPGARSRGS